MRYRPHSIPIGKAQRQLAGLVRRLRRLDRDLTRLADGILVRDSEPQSEVVQGVIRVVHTDLLLDAVETLDSMSKLGKDEAVSRALDLDELQSAATG